MDSRSIDDRDTALRQAVKQCVPTKAHTPKKPWITSDTLEFMKYKHVLEKGSDRDAYVAARKASAKAVKQDWEKWLAITVDKDLEIRDKWLGIKFIKRNYEPKLYEKVDRHKKLIDFDQHAEAAADSVENCQWPFVKPEENLPRTQAQEDKAEARKHSRPYKNDWICTPFLIQELRAVIKKMKKHKAAGPDKIPIEFYEWVDDDILAFLLDILNQWWSTGTFPNDKL